MASIDARNKVGNPNRYPPRPQNSLALVRLFAGAMYCYDSLLDIDGMTTFVDCLAVENGPSRYPL